MTEDNNISARIWYRTECLQAGQIICNQTEVLCKVVMVVKQSAFSAGKESPIHKEDEKIEEVEGE